jgi:hypothetical protein
MEDSPTIFSRKQLQMIYHVIPRERAMRFLHSETGGRIFSASFHKVDGSMRHMVCRRGVTKHLRGGTMRYDPTPRLMMPVFDLQKREYRILSVATMVSFKIGGEIFLVQD